MAYYLTEPYINDGKEHGPHPCDIDEFCGNTYKKGRPNKRLGRPQSCDGGTSKQMADLGYFEVYLKESKRESLKRVHGDKIRFVETPNSLKEPGI